MGNPGSANDQGGQYSDYDDTGICTDDYDDEVFVTLYIQKSQGKAPPKLLHKDCQDIFQIEINYA